VIVLTLWMTREPLSPDLTRLAVMPCENRLGDTAQEYIAAGVHDEIVNTLVGITGMEVRGRRSVQRYRDTAVVPQEIASQLGVSGLVECSVFLVGDSIRVSTSLLDATEDVQVWSTAVLGGTDDVFRLGRDAVLELVDFLGAVVTAADSARVQTPPTENQEAYDLYQRGRQLAYSHNGEQLRTAIELFDQAIALDSGFALAYATKAYALMNRGDVAGLRPAHYIDTARESVLRALELDSLLAEGHAILGEIYYAHDFAYVAGEREARRAVELDSANAAAWAGYGFSQSISGRDEEAISALRRAVELDPMNTTFLANLCWILNIARRHGEALEVARKGMRLAPENITFYWNAAEAALALGDSTGAVDLQERARDLAPDDDWSFISLGATYARVGRRGEALEILDSLKAMAQQRYVAPRRFSQIYLGLDSLDAAMDWLIRAAEDRTPGLNVNIREATYDVIRGHPRYPELMRLMRLER
jgi:TolB-like protein/tetratricopeptide (TPR) repeat protein